MNREWHGGTADRGQATVELALALPMVCLLLLAVALPLCAIGGLCWGLLTWYFNERIYRALQTSR